METAEERLIAMGEGPEDPQQAGLRESMREALDRLERMLDPESLGRAVADTVDEELGARARMLGGW